MRISRSRRCAGAAGACAAALTLALAGCSDTGGGSESGGEGAIVATPTAASRYTTPLAGICPGTVVVQTAWWPEADFGFAYQLLGPDPAIDKNANRVTGSLGATGVSLEIRSGGAAVGFQPVPSLLAQHDDILLGLVGTDEAIQHSGNQPTVAVFAPYEKAPLALLWGDPSWDFASVADIGQSGAPVLLTESESALLEVLVRERVLDPSKVDTSYQGAPDRFVAADGKIVQIGFATDEPYRLEHDVPAWGKPVEYLLLHDEFPIYQLALSVRQDKLAANRACLAKLVPLFQQAQRDYLADPGPTNQLLLHALDILDTAGFGQSPGLVADANAKQKELGLVADGPDGVLGSFDTTRVQELIDRLAPVFEARGSAPKPGLAPADLVTNEFLDPSISLG